MTMSALHARYGRIGLSALLVAILSGCASVNFDDGLGRVNQDAAAFTDNKLSLSRTSESQQERLQRAKVLLDQPLQQAQAVELALVNSPAVQVLLAQRWADAADAAQSGRIPNPVFTFERLKAGDELELNRALSFGLLDLLTLPVRQGIAERRIAQAQLQLTGDVVDLVTQIRQAWVRAVAAQQTLQYARQVYDVAQAGADLANRMQAVGNYSRLSRAREQAFYADAAAQLAMATNQVTSTREELVRLLGLDEADAQRMILPTQLPSLPKAPLSPEAVGAQASQARIDIRQAQLQWTAAAKAQGISTITSLTDIELTVRRNTKFDSAAGTTASPRGFEVGITLPLFDWGGMQRDAMNARTLAAANQLETTMRSAGSSLREGYAAYRAAYDIARHYQDEVVPLRKVIADENQLRYNGMIIGVFELLADARDQVATVMAAIDAQRQFWLSDAALQASLIGRPTANPSLSMTSSAAGGGSGGAGGH
jgi:outer membrane protein TolC